LFLARSTWSGSDIQTCVDATRVLCLVGTLRALGFVGPPLLDGIGRPELTLRYMVVATFAVPGSFMLGAWLLGDEVGVLSVAIAWAIGYPIAFAVLQFLVARSIDLPFALYARSSWGIVGCCLAGFVVGLAISYAIPNASDFVRLVSIGGSALAVTLVLVAYWQNITPRSIMAAVKG
jgi:hypothetical protein